MFPSCTTTKHHRLSPQIDQAELKASVEGSHHSLFVEPGHNPAQLEHVVDPRDALVVVPPRAVRAPVVRQEGVILLATCWRRGCHQRPGNARPVARGSGAPAARLRRDDEVDKSRLEVVLVLGVLDLLRGDAGGLGPLLERLDLERAELLAQRILVLLLLRL